MKPVLLVAKTIWFITCVAIFTSGAMLIAISVKNVESLLLLRMIVNSFFWIGLTICTGTVWADYLVHKYLFEKNLLPQLRETKKTFAMSILAFSVMGPLVFVSQFVLAAALIVSAYTLWQARGGKNVFATS